MFGFASRTPCRVGIACAHDKLALDSLPCAAVKLGRAGWVFADVQTANGVVSLDYRRKAVRAGIFGAVLLLVAYVMDWW